MSDPAMDGAAVERLHRVGGQKLVDQMIAIFLRNAPQRIATARQGQADGDPEAVERAVHSLRSSAGNVGAMQLQELAGKIESLAERKVWDGVFELLDELESAYRTVEAHLVREEEG